LEDVSHGGGVQMTGVEEAEVMTEVEVMTEAEIMTKAEVMENDVRKGKRVSLQRRLHEVKLGREHKSTGKLNLCS
jgi:hypothetical protein